MPEHYSEVATIYIYEAVGTSSSQALIADSHLFLETNRGQKGPLRCHREQGFTAQVGRWGYRSHAGLCAEIDCISEQMTSDSSRSYRRVPLSGATATHPGRGGGSGLKTTHGCVAKLLGADDICRKDEAVVGKSLHLDRFDAQGLALSSTRGRDCRRWTCSEKTIILTNLLLIRF